jgi:hypothetical protein
METEVIQNEIKEINEKMDLIMEALHTTDIKKNAEICKVIKITTKTLFNWIEQGCPRVSSTHCSLSKVKKWRRETITKK